MKEVGKDSEIRLFGKKIALPENGRVIFAGEDSGDGSISGSDHVPGMERVNKVEEQEEEEEDLEDGEFDDDDDDEVNEEIDEEMQEANKDCLGEDFCEGLEEEGGGGGEEEEESRNPDGSLESDENSGKPEANNKDSATVEPSKDDKDRGEGTGTQQKPLKKPDKILPCPRCNSMDTKFCYYNNYNVNQPRHFCKSCQRYWTAGGTMRNVPVGAGRRKNKNSASHCRHISISEALQAAQIDVPNGYHHPNFNTKGTVLSFGSDSPLCESMASVLNLTEKKAPNGTRNVYYKLDKGMPVAGKGGENGDDCSSGSSVTTTNSMADGGKKNVPQEPAVQSMNGLPSPVPCLPGIPWPFPWNSAVPMPAICPPGFPMPFYPAPYWNCSVPGPWSIPWLPPTSPSGSGPNSPTLGKHSRDGDLIQQNTPERKQSPPKKPEAPVLVPKTLRIDDPDEAAKSSIWATLGIKYHSVNKGGIFNAFPSKADKKKQANNPSPVLQANPAALSRSLSFQEAA